MARESKAKEHFGIQKLKELVDDILIVPELIKSSKGNRYYIFRPNGQEVAIEIKNDILDTQFPLNQIEREFIYRNIQRFKTNNPELLKIKPNE
ncbi:hypothetical protein N8009_02580 [Flavobacteriaceae bacterium]|nr:hypothetical protein [Flavobacteriaceae bacterium]